MAEELELGRAARRRLAEEVLRYADEYIDSLPNTPASHGPADPAMIEELGAAPPETGVELESLLARLDRAYETGIDTSSGKLLSFIPSGAIYTAAIGRMLAAVTNRYTATTHAAPGLVAIENSVVQWMCRLFELPGTASGVLLSGGSTANLTATVAARSRLGPDFGAGVVYTSIRAHHSVAKAASIAGIHPDRVRTVAADADLRLDASLLRAAVSEDVAAGLVPMLIVSTAGTTDTGTIDPLGACADIAATTGAWMHVDAAYGGFFMMTARGKQRLAGIERADSITIDAHKSLFFPFGVGGLLVRDRSELIRSLDGRGAYMQDVGTDDHLPSYFSMSPELTRPARGLEVWLALHLHGTDAFRNELDRMLDLAASAAHELAALDGITVMATPELSVVAFRATAGDDETRAIADHLNNSGDVHVSSTTVDGHFLIRLAFLSPRTGTEVAERAIELVAEAATLP